MPFEPVGCRIGELLRHTFVFLSGSFGPVADPCGRPPVSQDPVRLSCNSAWLAGLTEGQPGTDFLQTVTETLSGKAIPDLGITTAISEAVSSIVDQQERAATTIKNAVSALGDYSVRRDER